MSEERQGRSRSNNTEWSVETKKVPAASPALGSPSSSPEVVFQNYSIPQQHQNLAMRGGHRRAVEPIRKPSPKDITKQIRVYSNKEKGWTDVTATFIDDLNESWISKITFEMLDLDAIPGSPGDPEWGFLGKRSVQLGGTTNLQWVPKGSKKTQETTCRVVDSKNFQIYLQLHLLPLYSTSTAKQSNNDFLPRQEPILDLPASSNISPPATIETFSSPVPKATLQTDTATTKENIDQGPCTKPIGSFDGYPDVISDTSDEARRADEWMDLLKTKFHNRFEKQPGIMYDPVKIAVLDTGLDQMESSIKGAVRLKRVKVVKSFVLEDSSTSDEFGHGTHVASLLLKVAPHAQIFVLKIAQKEEILSAKSISDAINYAADELRVDIITMSFGLNKENADVQAAIRNAVYKSVIMFAAASNSGGNSEVKYPARKDEVVCIFATDGSGNPYNKNPNSMKNSGYHFATLGIGVKSSWPRKLQDPPLESSEASERRQSGTSFATPIAAGIAACIIEFAVVEDLSEEYLAILKTRQGMQKIFSRLMVDENLRSGFHYIYPWKMFANDRDNKAALTLMEDALKN